MPHGTARLPYLWREPSQSPTTAKFASISHNFVKGARDNSVQFLLINWPLWCLVEFGPRSIPFGIMPPPQPLTFTYASTPMPVAEMAMKGGRGRGSWVAWYHHVLADWYCRRSLNISKLPPSLPYIRLHSVMAYIPACIPVWPKLLIFCPTIRLVGTRFRETAGGMNQVIAFKAPSSAIAITRHQLDLRVECISKCIF
jgi:hypothetical protein